MSTMILEESRRHAAEPNPAATSSLASDPAESTAPTPAHAGQAYCGDRIALTLWLCGVTAMAYLLLKDLLLALWR